MSATVFPARLNTRSLSRILVFSATFICFLWLWVSPFPKKHWHGGLMPGRTTSPKKVVMVTASSGSGRILSLPNIKEQAYENRMTYAKKHGLEFMWANMTSYNLPHDEGLVWNKIPIIKEAFDRFPDAEWVWWIDIDIIIMNMTLNVYNHVLSQEGMARNVLLDKMISTAGGGDLGYRTPATYNYEDINFVISEDRWGMVAGTFLMRRSYWTTWLLDMWLEPLFVKENWVFAENDAWTHLWMHHDIVRNHSICVNQRSLNAYPSTNALGQSWQPGDFLIHFAGCNGGGECPNDWKRYWDMRERVEVPMSVRKKLADGTAEIENVQQGVAMSF